MAGKMRSPNYPAMAIAQAVELAKKLWMAEKKTAVTHETAAQAMGFKSLSGPARVAIGALRQYGLIDKAEKGHVRISDLMLEILHGHGTQQELALGRAAMTPDLFLELSKTHLEASENAIRSYLITKKGFAEDGARKAARAFVETKAFAIDGNPDYNPETMQEKPQAMPTIDMGQQLAPRSSDGAGVLSLKVPYGAGALAVEIRVTGEPLKRAHIERVRKYLELAEDDLADGN
jgi:hypothetical protein